MNRYEQRRAKRMQNPEFAAGYRAMDAEIQLVLALEAICEHRHISQETLAERMSKKLKDNPTLDTMIELLSALHITANITLREAKEGESPIHVVTELSS